MLAIYKRELKSYFQSMVGCVFVAFLVAFTGIYFMAYNLTAGYPYFSYTLSGSLIVFLVGVPLITMRSFSEERKNRTDQLLLTAPVGLGKIVMGKYLAMLIYGLVLVGVLLVYVIYAICVIENVDVAWIFTGLLGVYLLLCIYVSIGLFMSSLTSYQIVAAVGTLAVLAVLTYLQGMWQDVPFVREITYWFGMSGRTGALVGGLICSEDIIYFVVIIALFLCMTIIRMQSQRQRMSWMERWGKYFGVWMLAIALAYVTSRPVFKVYCDATQLKVNTLTPNSQDIIKRAEGGMTITTYVNILDKNMQLGLPASYNEDIRLFEQYVRFKPEIKMKYVYYYDTVKNDALEKAFPGLSYEEKAQKVIEQYDLNPRKVLSPSEIRSQIDLKTTEGNRFVRLIERESGEKTFLRVFDDRQLYPTEAEISAALKRLVMDLPTVGFVKGHGERETDRPGERSYSMFTHIPSVRAALINQGFDYADVDLNQPVPEDVSILVIAEMRSGMSEIEQANFDQYVARGGNLMIIGEPTRQDVMNPVLAPFGVKLMDGFLIQPEKEKKEEENVDNINLGPFAGLVAPANPVDLITVKPTAEAADIAYIFGMLREHHVITMPTVTGLEYTEDKGFKVTPLFMTDSTCWNELEIKNVVDQEVVCNPAVGEVQKSYAVGLALSRSVGSKEQRIIILGDADCLSDGEFGRTRPGLWAANYSIVQGGFFWMSDNEVPIDVRRPYAIDNSISTTEAGANVLRYLLVGVFPGLLLLLSLFIWIRRRSR